MSHKQVLFKLINWSETQGISSLTRESKIVQDAARQLAVESLLAEQLDA